ncbi:MAG: hypothetical protein HY508_04830 [Acidobacteria bacterium]|nr:hypothetical protein [Acidobacteriota bacterium]
MRKIYLLLVSLLGIASLALAETLPARPGSDQLSAPLQHDPAQTLVVVPAETEADIQLLSGIHSGVNHVGDRFAAQLLHPISVGGQVVLPAGSLIGGRITYIRPAGRLRRPAELGLRFELVTLPDGNDQPISALLTSLDAMHRTHTSVDSEGILKGTSTGTWKRLTGGLLGLGVFSAIETQIAGTAALGMSLPVGGAVLGYSFLVPKGNEVHVPPDTQMHIRLRHPLTFRVDW